MNSRKTTALRYFADSKDPPQKASDLLHEAGVDPNPAVTQGMKPCNYLMLSIFIFLGIRHAELMGSFMESDTSYKIGGFSFAFEGPVSEHRGTNHVWLKVKPAN